MLYVFNSLIVPCDFSKSDKYTILLRKVEVEEAKKLIRDFTDFISAIGHEATASLLTEILGVEIKTNRIAVKMNTGDRGLHFVLKERLPEGKILTREELEKLSYDLILSEVM